MTIVSSLGVSIVGFSALETIKLEKILSLTHARDRRYIVREPEAHKPVDVVLANADDTGAVNRGKALAGNAPKTILILIGSHPGNAAGNHFIAKPIISSRFIGTLDQITSPQAVQPPSLTPPENPPTNRDDRPLKAESQPIPAVAAAHRPKEYRILVVDDSELVHKALAIELKQALPDSYLDFAGSGEEALRHILCETVYDLIFLDIMMPGIDGYETCKAIRKDARYKSKIPIIMLSAKSSPLDEVKGVIAGCTTYLVKPISHEPFQAILRRVGAWLDQRTPSQPNPATPEHAPKPARSLARSASL